MPDQQTIAPRFDSDEIFCQNGLSLTREVFGKIIVRGSEQQLIAATASCGVDLPAPNTQTLAPGLQCLWQRPDRVLVLCDLHRQAGLIGQLNGSGAVALAAESQYCAYRIAGAAAADLINCGCSLDLRNGSFPINACAGTLIAKVPATLLRAGTDEYLVLVESALAVHFECWIAAVADTGSDGERK